MTTKIKKIVETKRVGYNGYYYLIVPDHASGHRARYTVYRIPGSPSRRTIIIGRELPLAHARRLIKDKIGE